MQLFMLRGGKIRLIQDVWIVLSVRVQDTNDQRMLLL